MEEMRKAYTPEPSNNKLDHMFDVKSWMEGCVENSISGHVHQHQFKFVMSNGKVVTYYKKWSTSPKWLPENGLLLVNELPSGVPKLTPPSSEKIPIRQLRQDLKKLEAKFTKETENWWKTFLDTIENGDEGNHSWLLNHLRRSKKLVLQFLGSQTKKDG